MKSITFILGIGLAVSAQAKNQPVLHQRITAIHQTQTTDNRAVKNFHAIASAGSFKIDVQLGEEESLTIDGNPEDISRIETVVENGILKIRTKRNFKSWNAVGHEVSIHIMAKRLDALSLSGSGSMVLDGVLNAPSADIQLSGSGEITASVDNQNTSLALSGSGNIHVSGKSGSVNIAVSGSGDVKAEDLTTDTSNIKIAGSGNVYIQTEKDLNAAIFGSGSVKYAGNPNVSVSKLGSGSVSPL
ncbi:MAG: DUF2807 domain-containing protein [Sphingobacteriales bacterium]|nr:DUF2807 domain-containing protein [Sphingobacteriales bacterium]